MAVTLAPGPMVLFVFCRSLSGDWIGTCLFALGVYIGDLVAVAILSFSMASWLTGGTAVGTYLNIAFLLYVGWIANDIWFGRHLGEGSAPNQLKPLMSTLAGVAISIASPQTVALYALLISSIALQPSSGLQAIALMAPLIFLALGVSFGIVAFVARKVSSVTRHRVRPKLVNSALAISLLVAASSLAAH